MIVVDASVAAKWLFTEDHSNEARALLRTSLDSAEPIAAPSLLPIEITNILRQRMRRDGLLLDDAVQRLTAFLAVPVRLLTSNRLHIRALEIAERYKLPATYDTHYVALAEYLDCLLWTDDQRLLNGLQGRLAFVRWIGEYQPKEEES